MSDTKLRNFHEAQWDEDLIFEQSVPGSRSLLVPDVSKEAGAVTIEQVLAYALRRLGSGR